MSIFNTSREIPATVEQVFAAISDPDRLARWWGPAGFTNTSSVCEFKIGGRWSFVIGLLPKTPVFRRDLNCGFDIKLGGQSGK